MPFSPHRTSDLKVQAFKATIQKSGSTAYIGIPFDPDEAWGEKDRHYVKGTVGGRSFRGILVFNGEQHILRLGPAWRRDNGIEIGDNIDVALEPDGPQTELLADDIASALDASRKARALFDSVAPFYRKNFIRWIEQAKRAETRAARIAEMVKMLEAGKLR